MRRKINQGQSYSSNLRKNEVHMAYGMAPNQPPCPCELDHLIPLGLGGTNWLANLWPHSD